MLYNVETGFAELVCHFNYHRIALLSVIFDTIIFN
ncbi:hypothetical protein SAMN05421780_10250 [Flexibacter flexilis DSM 6793]|uniref:Uncharacterized protein n=1 Tax=Flexibacter flexilis DSM 6793 TaxID=927664 RepID=A0A1I1F4X6_9BACT|nr:hypothetical protein SAMN05421780_10250 [Flexibacter flexilis DSM 6793]